jgi:hypothetical protein
MMTTKTPFLTQRGGVFFESVPISRSTGYRSYIGKLMSGITDAALHLTRYLLIDSILRLIHAIYKSRLL